MIVVAWVLLACFSLIGFLMMRKFLFAKVNKYELFVLFFSIIVSAMSAGVIWGGLLK